MCQLYYKRSVNITKNLRIIKKIEKSWYHSEDVIAETKEYYDFNKVILQKPSRKSYRNLSDKDKGDNKDYEKNEYKNDIDATSQ